MYQAWSLHLQNYDVVTACLNLYTYYHWMMNGRLSYQNPNWDHQERLASTYGFALPLEPSAALASFIKFGGIRTGSSHFSNKLSNLSIAASSNLSQNMAQQGGCHSRASAAIKRHLLTLSWEYEFGGLERWNGTVEWTTGVEYWTGLLECHAHNNRSWLRVLHLWLDISLLMFRYHTVSHYSNASCITITAFAKLLI